MSAIDDALWPRAALPRRPMLGAVLDALTVTGPGDPLPSFWCATGLPTTTVDRGNVIVVGSPYHSVRYPWIDASVTEAYELLQARGLIPMEYVGRFVCWTCGAFGSLRGDDGSDGRVVCPGCAIDDTRATGHRPHPSSVADLAAWASIGFAPSDDGEHPGILGAEELMTTFDNGHRPMWTVAPIPREALDTHARGDHGAVRIWRAGIGAYATGAMRAGQVALRAPPLGLVTP